MLEQRKKYKHYNEVNLKHGNRASKQTKTKTPIEDIIYEERRYAPRRSEQWRLHQHDIPDPNKPAPPDTHEHL